MKKIIGFMFFILILGSVAVMGQNIPIYPIPSNNVPVEGLADFTQLPTKPVNISKEKRNVIIHLKSGTGIPGVKATIWVYSLDKTTILGPFNMTCGQTLTVGIDNRNWGVLVKSSDDVVVDVWIEDEMLK